MRRAWLVGVLLVAACSSRSRVPCSTQVECARFNAVCLEGYCQLPEEVDLGGYDLLDPPDFSSPLDFTVASPPDLSLSCASGQSCPVDKPICGGDQMCRACVATDRPTCLAGNILTPRCDETSGACAACRNDHEALDCPDTGLSVCGSDGSCRQACTAHGDCASGICDPRILTTDQASCARADEIVYVRPMTGCTPPHAGTEADPFCTVDDAIAARPNGGFIRVLAGNTFALERVKTAIAKPYVLVGTGQFLAGDEQLSGTTFHRDAIHITKGGRLYMEGIGVGGATGDGIDCDGTGGSAQLVLRDVDLANAKPTAISTKNCDVDLDRVRMRDGANGLDHDGGALRLVNTYIYRNAGVAVRTSSATSAGLVAYLTIADNTPANASQPGGFVCGAGMTIRNSISWGNQAVSNAMYSGACAFRYSSLNPAVSGAGNNNSQPKFTPNNFALGILSDYHLVAGMNPCCTGTAEVIPEVTLDWDRQTRGAPPEMGADEL